MPSFKALIICLLLLSACGSFAQVATQPDTAKLNDKSFAKVEMEAEYPGGVAACFRGWCIFYH